MAFLSCNKFDDSQIWDKLNDHENRILLLEELCKKLNADIINLQTVVTALETNDYIVNASPLATGDGYTLIFRSGKSIVIYNGNYDYYKEHLQIDNNENKSLIEIKRETNSSYTEDRKNKAQDRKRRAKLMNTEKEMENLQNEIETAKNNVSSMQDIVERQDLSKEEKENLFDYAGYKMHIRGEVSEIDYKKFKSVFEEIVLSTKKRIFKISSSLEYS